MYSLSAYGRMLSDPCRFAAYRRALERSVRPGDVVVDLGAGPGVFAVLAARLGARRVLAVEPDPVVELVAELAAAHGVADRVEVHAVRADALEIDEPVDVLVADLRGVLPVHADHFDILASARRWLRPGGVAIPARDHLRVVPVTAPTAYGDLVDAWASPHLVAAGLDLDAARRRAVHSIGRVSLPASAAVAPARTWATVEYAALDPERPLAELRGQVAWRVETAAETDAEVHGLALFFESELVESDPSELLVDALRSTGPADAGTTLSSGPGGAAAGRAEVYGQAFLPWPSPRRLEVGAALEVALQARRVGDGWVWRWRTRIDGEQVLDQSTFFGAPLDRGRLAERALGAAREENEVSDARPEAGDGVLASRPSRRSPS